MTVKFAIDRGNIKQIVKEHVAVAPKQASLLMLLSEDLDAQYEGLGLPTVEELPNTDFEVGPALTRPH